jgi:uncharacterized phage protein gp47/JayE
MTVVVNSINPNKFSAYEDVQITIYGANFVAPVVPSINGILLQNVVTVSTTLVTGTLPALSLNPGVYSLLVVNGNAETFTLEDSYRAVYQLPTPPFESESYNTVVTRMLANSPANRNKLDGSFFRDLINAFGFMVARLYADINYVFQIIFMQTAYGAYLDLRAQEYGVFRIASVKATGTARFTGTIGAAVPIGTRISTVIDINSLSPATYFETTAAGVINGSGLADIPIRAILAGNAGNLSPNTIVRIGSNVANVLTVNNSGSTSGGLDRETDTHFRNRFLDIMKEPVAGGTKSDYEAWAKQVDGVEDSLCVPLWNGNGTVKVVITATGGGVPSGSLVTAVQDYIDPTPGMGGGLAPIGANVTVVAVTLTNINIIANTVIKTGYSGAAVRAAVAANLVSYLNALGPGETVYYTAIGNVIYDTDGVLDYNSLTINTAFANVAIASDHKAHPNTIAIS